MTRQMRVGMYPLALAAIVVISLLAGCSKDKERSKILQRPGRVASIDTQTGIVEMWTYSPKQKKEIKIPGTLDPNVEIMINGATASLADVNIDDKVMVTGRVIKTDGESKFMALKVEVTRPEATTAPAPETQEAVTP